VGFSARAFRSNSRKVAVRSDSDPTPSGVARHFPRRIFRARRREKLLNEAAAQQTA